MRAQPNVLFVMTDQQRFDTIAALGNQHIYTPNLDRLVRRGVSFTSAYSTCPVCVPARYTIRTGCEPPATRIFSNRISGPAPGQADTIEGRCGPYLATVMRQLGYRTFGIGKFHSSPSREPLGYDVHLHSEELYGSPEDRATDAYAAWLAREHPEYDHLEQLMGERTEMYYMPQMSAQPADCAVEAWAADRSVEQIGADDGRPWFGFVSFIGPAPSPRPADPLQPHVRPGPHARPCPRRRRHRPHGPADPAHEPRDLGGVHQRPARPHPQGALLRRDLLHRRLPGPDPRRGRITRGRGRHADLLLLRPWRAPGRPPRLAEGELLRGQRARPVPGELAGAPRL